MEHDIGQLKGGELAGIAADEQGIQRARAVGAQQTEHSQRSVASPAAAQRNQVYSLFFTLQDAYIWKIEYGREDIFEENLHRLEEMLK